jgi:hypothetical protein
MSESWPITVTFHVVPMVGPDRWTVAAVLVSAIGTGAWRGHMRQALERGEA